MFFCAIYTTAALVLLGGCATSFENSASSKQKRQIFREQVLPAFGGKIPEDAFRADRLALNRLNALGIAIPDGILLEHRHNEKHHNSQRQDPDLEASVIKLVQTSDGRYVPPEGQFAASAAAHNQVESTYVIRDPVGYKNHLQAQKPRPGPSVSIPTDQNYPNYVNNGYNYNDVSSPMSFMHHYDLPTFYSKPSMSQLITLFFGANDLCSGTCYDKEGTSALQHKKKLQIALDYLQENLPRTLVNLVPVLDVSVSMRVKRSLICRFLHRFFCTCFHQSGNIDEMAVITQLVRDYQRAEENLVNSGRYNKKEDFTVVIQPFIKLFNAPPKANGKVKFKEVIDISYVTYDCFHFSQKGHALAANLLWNNLLEPLGTKTEVAMNYVMERFLCPTLERPYIFTYNNTLNFFQYGRQDGPAPSPVHLEATKNELNF